MITETQEASILQKIEHGYSVEEIASAEKIITGHIWNAAKKNGLDDKLKENTKMANLNKAPDLNDILEKEEKAEAKKGRPKGSKKLVEGTISKETGSMPGTTGQVRRRVEKEIVEEAVKKTEEVIKTGKHNIDEWKEIAQSRGYKKVEEFIDDCINYYLKNKNYMEELNKKILLQDIIIGKLSKVLSEREEKIRKKKFVENLTYIQAFKGEINNKLLESYLNG